MARLAGKVAIITGAASGIGLAQAELFVREGASVVIADIAAAGKQVADNIGNGALFVQHDVANEKSWAELVSSCEERFGPPTILVNTAGVTKNVALVDTTVADFERMFRINQLGVFLGVRCVVEPMKRVGGGSIVNIASIAGMGGMPGLCAYGSSKWGVRGITRVAAKELAPFHIRVNTLFPGAVDTPINTPEVLRIFHEQVKHNLPLQRMGDTAELARATLFLASDDASYVTGAELVVDGGLIA